MDKMKQPLVFHVGFPKTGTTAIQTYLMNQARIAYFGKERREQEDYHSTSNRLVRCVLASDEIRFQESLPELVESVALEADGKALTVVSDEYFTFAEYMYLGERLWQGTVVSDHVTVSRRLHQFDPDALVLAGVRNQVSFIESFFLQYQKLGYEVSFADMFEDFFFHTETRAAANLIKYEEFFDAYQKRFGADRILLYSFAAFGADLARVIELLLAKAELQDAGLSPPTGGIARVNERIQRSEAYQSLRSLTPQPVRSLVPTRLKVAVHGLFPKKNQSVTWTPKQLRKVADFYRAPNERFRALSGIDLNGEITVELSRRGGI